MIQKAILFLVFIFLATVVIFFTLKLDYIKGVIWQPTLDYNTPKGSWNYLGADTLLIQWTYLEKKAWIDGIDYPLWEPVPDWQDILSQPWAKNIIFGLSCDFNISKARNTCNYHREVSIDIANSIKKLNISNPIKGWYAPIEIDIYWSDSNIIHDYVKGMPRPLYISSFVGKYNNPVEYAKWVSSWLPKDVHLLFQDSVGTGVLEAKEVTQYIQALTDELGDNRVSVILEAFTMSKNKKLKKANFSSIANRLLAYKKMNIPVYIFSCRYLNNWDIFYLKLYLLFYS